jgi:hypothetical protein
MGIEPHLDLLVFGLDVLLGVGDVLPLKDAGGIKKEQKPRRAYTSQPRATKHMVTTERSKKKKEEHENDAKMRRK